MPVLQPTPPFLRVQAFYRVGASECLNQFYYGPAGDGGTDVQVQEFLDAWQAAVEGAWLALISADAEVLYWQAQYRSTTDLIEKANPGGVGGGGVEALPPQDAGIITWHYPTPGVRISRGKTFFSGLPESAQNKGVMNDSTVDDLNALADLLMGSFTFAGNDVLLQVWSPSFNVLNTVTGHNVNPVMKTIRNRRPLS